MEGEEVLCVADGGGRAGYDRVGPGRSGLGAPISRR